MKVVQQIKNINAAHDCCHVENIMPPNGLKRIVLVGSPNVGKSALFNELTDSYVTVSNYPGTTVGIAKTTIKIEGQNYEVIDTPGMYSFISITEEEKITRRIIFTGTKDVIVHVVDAKNIERMLPLTLQLIETNTPVILVLNLMDELDKYKIKIDIPALEKLLQIPIIPTVATKGIGINTIKKTVKSYKYQSLTNDRITYDNSTEQKLNRVKSLLVKNNLRISKALALLLLQIEPKEIDFISGDINFISKIKQLNDSKTGRPLFYDIALAKQQKATEITQQVLSEQKRIKFTIADKLNELMINPLTGIPILVTVIYIGLYEIVGKFGAGVAVDFIETTVFEKYFNPFVIQLVPRIIPWQILQNLFVGEYGVLTLGLRYAVAIILPIVGTFFFVFAIIEDSGYLPRLAMLIDRVFKKIGLSGRAVIPMVLGLGCSTMATMVTRTLPTKRERIMATILLALAIPCSAQLGVLFTLLVQYPTALMVWGMIITVVFLTVGYLGAKLLPGNPPIFFMEVPPLRLPALSNIVIKTYARIVWYLKEVFPLFMVASLLLWFGQIIGVFDVLVRGLSYPMKLLGLPEKTAVAYIFGFFRRDFGAAGLYDMQKAGLFNLNQLTIAIITMTLFPACVAQALMMIKERGRKSGMAIFAFCLAASFVTGFLINLLFNVFKIKL